MRSFLQLTTHWENTEANLIDGLEHHLQTILMFMLAKMLLFYTGPNAKPKLLL